tara:strand:- start:1321 stop:1974 length:654 start_codon:yes stop_codon:yes gene_type:complete
MNPDKDIENFWLTFKNCITNFLKEFNVNLNINNIDEISLVLNNFQKNKEYQNIEYTINNYMFFLIQKLLEKITYLNDKKSSYLYYSKIILTNIKRWEKIREKKIFFKDPIKNEDLYYLVVDCFKSCIKSIEKKRNIDIIIKFFINISSNIIFATNEKTKIIIYQKLIDFAIDINVNSIIDIVKNKYDIAEYLNIKYDINLPKTMSGKKINYFMQKLM